MSTAEQIAALKANREELKAPLRARYHAITAEIDALRAPERALQAQRDQAIDNLTAAEDRALVGEIKAAKEQAIAGGVQALEAERREILKALRDDDGKVRL